MRKKKIVEKMKSKEKEFKKIHNELIMGLSDDVVELSKKELLYRKIIVDLETIIRWHNSLIFSLNGTVEAQNYRMWWYNDFINEYDGQLLEISKTLESRDKKAIAKQIKKIKGKIRELLPKEDRRYGPIKHKSKS